MFEKHKILYVLNYCDYIVDPLHLIFIESFIAFMHVSAAVEISNNGLSYKRLTELFNEEFLNSFNTQLEAGHSEPIYIPPQKNQPAKVCFRADYASSALHEIAHWCIAGEQRRQQLDYGYWYEPDGRSDAQQRDFEKVEVKPQALEWIFSLAAGVRFNISADNLNGDIENSCFADNVAKQAAEYLKTGLPTRAEIFYQKLLAAGQGKAAELQDFVVAL